MAVRCNQFSIEHILGGGGSGGGSGGGGGRDDSGSKSGSKSPASALSDVESSDEATAAVAETTFGIGDLSPLPTGSGSHPHPWMDSSDCSAFSNQWTRIKTPFFTLQGKFSSFILIKSYVINLNEI